MPKYNKLTLISIVITFLLFIAVSPKAEVPQHPRVLISTDIGGTDPDDNQSMTHLLMYSDLFDLEGLVSSPSYGDGSKEEIIRMIDLYEKDYSKLIECYPNLMSPKDLRKMTKQGHKGLSPYKGYTESTEGSEWIVNQARKKSDRPLWVLVWGTLEDLAQALHDAPDIESYIRVYWIGGPNKKWGTNSYAYVVENFPNLWIIENDATYRGFIYNPRIDTEENYGKGYYNYAMKGNGVLGEDFINYYEGIVKMGDTPSLLYMMDGDPHDPSRESWGGSFTHMKYSSRRIINLNEKQANSESFSVPVYSIIELHLKGPEKDINEDTPCFNVTIDKQVWHGFYLGKGDYAIRYTPKASAFLTYQISSDIKELNNISGKFEVTNDWPGVYDEADYIVGNDWYTDKQDDVFFEDKWQGAGTIRKWRKEILEDWKKRWDCFREN